MNIHSQLGRRARVFLKNCRLCWHVGLVVTASIVLIEAIILIPSYRNYERDLLRRLEHEGRATIASLFLMGHHADESNLQLFAAKVVGGSVVKGVVIYRVDGSVIARAGIAPALGAAAQAGELTQTRTNGGRSFDARWTEKELGAPYVVTARLDAAWIDADLRSFVVRIIGLVLLISTFVTLATMGILGRSVLIPLLRLRRNLMAAADDPEHPDRYTIAGDRRDELGDVTQAFNRMIHDVASSHRREMQRVVAMSENSIAAVVAYDGEGELIYCNEAFLALCGIAAAGDLRAGFPRVADRDRPPVPLARHLARAVATEEVSLEVTPGKFRPCLVGGNQLRDDSGGLELCYASILEVSEMQAYRERLEAKNLELAAANRAKSEFLAHMSHELRTPLNAILGFSELMKEESLGPLGSDRYREYAGDIHHSGTLLLNIIGDILDLSKIEAGKTELMEQVVDIPDTVAACLRLVADRAATAEITIATKWQDGLPALRADSRLLKQILLNLLSNALKFTPAGGRVTIGAELSGTGGLALSVSDTGVGMAKEDIPTALAPFGQVGTSLTARPGGTGLGLPLVKSFIDLHGGWLDIRSQPGAGTTVTVHFPIERVVAAVPSESSAA